jgi:isoleucyl-tRNA synthetase
MSKRWKNYTPPEELISAFGADSVRLYMLNSAVLRAEDLRFSNDGVKETTRSVILPLWNAFSFLTTYAAADGWQPTAQLVTGAAPQVSGEMDRWLISRLHTLIAGVHKEMEGYHLYNVVPRVLAFIEDLTNWYIRLSRRRFWAGDKTLSADTREAYETLYYVMTAFAKILAPFAPFTAERIYRGLTEGLADVPASVHLCDLPVADDKVIDSALERRMDLVRTVTDLGRSLRAKHQIKTRQVLPGMIVITRSQTDADHVASAQGIIKNELNLKELQFSTDETQFVNLAVKPNLKTLGKRLGKDLNSLRSHFEELNKNPQQVARLLAAVESGAGTQLLGHSLSIEDFLIDRGPKDDRLIATAMGVTVLLDTNLTAELILEGLAREVVNRVQNFRKDSGLYVTDKIDIQIQAGEEISRAVQLFQEYIKVETQGRSLTVVGSLSTEFKTTFELAEESIQLGITRLHG